MKKNKKNQKKKHRPVHIERKVLQTSDLGAAAHYPISHFCTCDSSGHVSRLTVLTSTALLFLIPDPYRVVYSARAVTLTLTPCQLSSWTYYLLTYVRAVSDFLKPNCYYHFRFASS